MSSTDETVDDVFFSKGAPVFSVLPTKSSTLFEGFSELSRNKILTDYKLICHGQEFNVHRLVLYAHSKYFRQILIQEKNAKSCELDTDPESLGFLLTFLYEGKLNNIPLEKAEKVAKLAEDLEIEELATKCKIALLENLPPCPDSCLTAWCVAASINDQNFMKKFSKVAMVNFASLKDSSDFLDLPFTVLKEYVTNSSLPVAVADERLSAAIEWLHVDPVNRGGQFHELMRLLPLQNMNKGFLQVVQREAILKANPEIQNVIDEALGSPQAKSLKDQVFKPNTDCRDEAIGEAGHAMSSSSSLQDYIAVMWHGKHGIFAYTSDSVLPETTIHPPDAHRNDELGYAACCSNATNLFVSGIGQKHNKVYRYDVMTGSWTYMCDLTYGRRCHCMLEKGGSLFIFGGHDPESKLLTRFVEEVIVESRKNKRTGYIEGDDCLNTCCSFIDQDDIAVFGTYYDYSDDDPNDDTKKLVLQVYSSVDRVVTHFMAVPGDSNRVCGIISAAGSIIYSDMYNIYTCTLDNLYKQESSVLPLRYYRPPNGDCTVSRSVARGKVMVLGGDSKHSAYEADISDLLYDTTKGWQPKLLEQRNQLSSFPGAVCTAKMPQRRSAMIV